MATKYVIRKYEFWFDDDSHYVSSEAGGDIGGVYQAFDDENMARQTYRALLLESLKKPNNHYRFTSEFSWEVSQFVQQQLSDESYYFHIWEGLPDQLDDDALLEFADKIGWLPYYLFSFETNEQLYAVWECALNSYLISRMRNGDRTPTIVGENGSDIAEDAFGIGCENRLLSALSCKLILCGTPEELSNSPELLKQFLALPDTGIIYDAENHVIEYGQNQPPLFQQYLHTFNSLLKQPIYELHPIRPDQIKQVFENPTVKIA